MLLRDGSFSSQQLVSNFEPSHRRSSAEAIEIFQDLAPYKSENRYDHGWKTAKRINTGRKVKNHLKQDLFQLK
jgi:hypothetical protein